MLYRIYVVVQPLPRCKIIGDLVSAFCECLWLFVGMPPTCSSAFVGREPGETKDHGQTQKRTRPHTQYNTTGIRSANHLCLTITLLYYMLHVLHEKTAKRENWFVYTLYYIFGVKNLIHNLIIRACIDHYNFSFLYSSIGKYHTLFI